MRSLAGLYDFRDTQTICQHEENEGCASLTSFMLIECVTLTFFFHVFFPKFQVYHLSFIQNSVNLNDSMSKMRLKLMLTKNYDVIHSL